MTAPARSLALVACLGLFAAARPATEPPADEHSVQIVDSYLAATQSQRDRLHGSTATVSIDAELPRLRQRGRLSAIRHISTIGRITYDILRFDGDSSVKNQVIARYLSAEAQVREEGGDAVAVTPQNYKFSYKGAREMEGRRVHLFELKPRAKRKGLFKGTLAIDAQTFLPLRESGRLVKNPSIFIKKVQFTRDYRLQDGLAVLSRLESTVETRVAGAARLTVEYADYQIEAPPAKVVTDGQ